MPNAIAVGSGPVAFTTSKGKFLLIPLSAITFVDNELTLSAAYDGDYKKELDAWLQYLAKIGSLKPGATPPPKPALKIEAADAGVASNNIQVEFKNIDNNTFDVVITKEETYKISYNQTDANSPNFITNLLATESEGLVHIKGNIDLNNFPPDKGKYKLKNGADNANSSQNVPGKNSINAFTLEARKLGEDGDLTTVTIPNAIDTQAETFTLVAVWQKELKGIKLIDLPGKSKPDYLVYFDSPSPPNVGAIPAAGIIQLGGGADKQEAKPASAVAFTS